MNREPLQFPIQQQQMASRPSHMMKMVHQDNGLDSAAGGHRDDGVCISNLALHHQEQPVPDSSSSLNPGKHMTLFRGIFRVNPVVPVTTPPIPSAATLYTTTTDPDHWDFVSDQRSYRIQPRWHTPSLLPRLNLSWTGLSPRGRDQSFITASTALPMEEVVIRQKPSPLPALSPEQDHITSEQWVLLLALADAIVPSITPGHGNKYLQQPLRRDVYEAGLARLSQVAGPDSGVVANYLDERATGDPQFRASMSRTLNLYLPTQPRWELTMTLNALK
nr:hypothetical protein CFP56_67365 [Quercus suber]